MSLEDIEKLRVRVEKDPQSRLFLPLAEEYRKTGMLDEAIAVLLNGLERHPGYTSARVTLGKIYLEMNRVQEAREEFEQVVSAVPDNLFAHRKLADIYREKGDQARAIRQYQRVLQLNPRDEDARTCLEQLEGGAAPAEPALPAFQEVEIAATEAGEALTMDLEDLPEINDVAPSGESPDVSEEAPPQTYEEFKSFFSDAGGQSYEEAFEIPGEKSPESIPEQTAEPELVPETSDDLSLPPLELGDVDLSSFPSVELEDFDYPEAVETEGHAVPLEAAEEDTFSLREESLGEPFPETEEESSFLSAEIDDTYNAGTPAQELEADLAYADTFVAQGEYTKAMKIFQECLKKNPGNRHILQRIAELREFLRIIGKGEDVVIARLETFLAGIYRRRDEFFGNS